MSATSFKLNSAFGVLLIMDLILPSGGQGRRTVAGSTEAYLMCLMRTFEYKKGDFAFHQWLADGCKGGLAVTRQFPGRHLRSYR